MSWWLIPGITEKDVFAVVKFLEAVAVGAFFVAIGVLVWLAR